MLFFSSSFLPFFQCALSGRWLLMIVVFRRVSYYFYLFIFLGKAILCSRCLPQVSSKFFFLLLFLRKLGLFWCTFFKKKLGLFGVPFFKGSWAFFGVPFLKFKLHLFSFALFCVACSRPIFFFHVFGVISTAGLLCCVL